MRKLLFAALAFGSAATVRADIVPGILFNNGSQALNIQGTIGSGTDYAFLDIDFAQNSSPGPAYTFEYKFNPTSPPETETQMISDIAAATAKTALPLAVSSDQTFGQTGDYSFNYAGNTGLQPGYDSLGNYFYWASYFGQYNAASQSIAWEFAPTGTDDTPLGYYNYTEDNNFNVTYLPPFQDGLFYGFTVNEYPGNEITPNVALANVPEPATGALIFGIASCFLLKRNQLSR